MTQPNSAHFYPNQFNPERQKLSPQEEQSRFMQAQARYEGDQKSPVVMWLMWLFLGGIGGHRYYLGNVGYAVGMTLTLGGLGIWTLIDAFFINGALRRENAKIRQTHFNQAGIGHLA